MGRKLGSKLPTVFEAPQKLSILPILGNADNAQIGFGVGNDVLKILPRAGDDKDLPRQSVGIKAQRDGADDLMHIQILGNLFGIQQVADVATVALIPAKAVHVGGGLFHFLHKGSG